MDLMVSQEIQNKNLKKAKMEKQKSATSVSQNNSSIEVKVVSGPVHKDPTNNQ